MADLIANADGNLTGSTTFAATETGTSAKALVRANTTSVGSNASVTSPTFTITNGKVIDGILLWVQQQATSSASTFKVDLQKGGVSQASLTVNTSDLPPNPLAVSNPAPTLFKFGSTVTGDGGSNWTIVITVSNAVGGVLYSRNSATTGDFTRALRTTTAAAPAAGDNLIIVGELTGAGTHNSRAVTMDSTAATVYGNGSVNSTTVYGGLLAIGNYASLTYGTSASTDYILRLAGDLIVYSNGTFDDGSSGMPRNSTGVLEFQPVSASGDFGVQVLGTGVFLGAGLSRTSGKNVVQCKLTSDVINASTYAGTGGNNGSTFTTNLGIDQSGTSVLAGVQIGNTANSEHGNYWQMQSSTVVATTTQSVSVWLARGSGTFNRYMRASIGNATLHAGITSGFYVDIDLQLGTIGSVTNIGAGSGTNASITAVGDGYILRMTGICSTSATVTPRFILNGCSAAGTYSFVGDTTQMYRLASFVAVNGTLSDTTLNIDTDTGWLAGDVVCLAPTNRNNTEVEDYAIKSNAGASSLTVATYPTATHSGTSPTQAEVGLLTRNVKIRSTSSTLWAYIYAEATATLTLSWVEMYYLGLNATNKRGIEIKDGATAGAKSITYCSMHDMYNAFYVVGTGGASVNATFSNNVTFNTSTSTVVISSATASNWTMDSNLFVKGGGNTAASLADSTGTFTNNTIAGPGSVGLGLSGSSAHAALGTFSGNCIHSSGSAAVQVSGTCPSGIMDTLKVYRCAAAALVSPSGTTAELFWKDFTIFGCGSFTGQIQISGGDIFNVIGTSNVMAGDTTFSTQSGIYSQTSTEFRVQNLDMSGVGGIYAPHTSSDILLSSSSTNYFSGYFNDCKFGAPTLIGSKSSGMSPSSYISFQRYNGMAGDHRTEMCYGQIKTDTSIYNAASPSMRLTPSSASSKLESAPKNNKGKLFAINSGQSLTISASVRKSAVGDGAAYNGSQPRLIARANPAIGIDADTVLATYSASAGSWNSLSGATPTATDDGAVEIIVDCDGTTGWINVDDLLAA